MTEHAFVVEWAIVEGNGRTIKENNLDKPHNIPIGTLVEVKYDEWCGNGACLKVHARLWVVKHTRDCDGTPLYTLSKRREPSNAIIQVDGLVLNDEISSAIYNEYVTGISEEQLTPVEITEELLEGYGSLGWEDEIAKN